MTKLIRVAAGSLIAAGLVVASANAAEHKLKATLNTASEVPPVTGAGKGTAEFTLNDATKEITYKVTFEGLSGDALAAHIHGPAGVGENGGVVASLGTAGTPPKSPIEGKATLTDEQVKAVLDGKTYVNVHTMQNKGGEIRGQIGK
jgi:Cu/Zn superoxide dismutase